MRIKDFVILFISSICFGWFLLYSKPTYKDSVTIQTDTTIFVNVQNKRALFIGDSHTSNRTNGWQNQLCKLTGLKQVNPSESGKTTYWMINMAVYKLDNKFDYCFVYGGANDMYTNSITPQEAVDNIKGIAKICNKLNVKCVVLTGFNPDLCNQTPNKKYPSRYKEFQRLLLTQYMEGAIVVDTRVVDKRDCWDDLCHMAPSGHKKIAEKIITDLNFQKI